MKELIVKLTISVFANNQAHALQVLQERLEHPEGPTKDAHCVSVLSTQGRTRLVDGGQMTSAHRAKADRASRLFKSVPLSDVERMPDPDYGF